LYQAKDIYTQRWLMEKNFPKPAEVTTLLRYLVDHSNESLRPADLNNQLNIDFAAINSGIDLLKHLNLLDVDAHGIRAREISGSQFPYIDMTFLDARKERDSSRLNQIIKYAQSQQCRREFILEYFGQKLENCSGCDTCHPVERRFALWSAATEQTTGLGVSKVQSKGPAPKSKFGGSTYKSSGKSYKDTDDELRRAILELTGELSGKVGRTTIASILAGSKAKKLTEKKLDKLPAYASFAHVRTDTIMDTIDALVSENRLRVIAGMYPKLALKD
jgi:superfamily II DNA helicase RecQ